MIVLQWTPSLQAFQHCTWQLWFQLDSLSMEGATSFILMKVETFERKHDWLLKENIPSHQRWLGKFPFSIHTKPSLFSFLQLCFLSSFLACFLSAYISRHLCFFYSCWLNYRTHFIWVFISPVVAIIFVRQGWLSLRKSGGDSWKMWWKKNGESNGK